MSDLDLEDRLTHSLRRGAGAAPLPSGTVRQGVRRRSRALQRRRSAVRAASVATAASLVAGAGVWLGSDRRSDPVSTADDSAIDPSRAGPWPAPPAGDGSLPTFAIDGFVRQPGTGSEGEAGSAEEPDPSLSHQDFRQPGNYSGPVVGVEHKVCDNCGDLETRLPDPAHADQVTVNGRDAQLWLLDPDGRILSWTLADGSRVLVVARDLTTPELLQFAEGLERSGTGDTAGFTATELPRGLAEDTTDAVFYMDVDRRIDFFEPEAGTGPRSTSLTVMRGDERLVVDQTGPFSNNLYIDVAEPLTVLGRPAVLLHVDAAGVGGPSDLDPYWSLVWRHTTDSVVELRVFGIDRAEMDGIIAGLSET